MKLSIPLIASLVALVAFSAEGADITGDWAATIVTAVGEREYTYVFRQSGAKLIGTARSQDGVAAISNGFVNNKTITFDENVTVEGPAPCSNTRASWFRIPRSNSNAR